LEFLYVVRSDKKKFMFEINESDLKKRKKNHHFSYLINGNDFVSNYYHEFFKIILYHDKVGNYNYIGDKIPDNIRTEIIDKAYDDLLYWADYKKSRLAYLILAYYIMGWGANMHPNLRKLALEYSKWKYERHQLKNKSDRRERRKFLLDFRAKLFAYKDGQKVKLPPRIYTEERRQIINYRI